MNQLELRTVFDQQAATYDDQWSKLAPVRDTVHLLIEALFTELPQRARILCVGAGTGAEILYLAARFPDWQFTAVEPSGRMLDVCRRRAEAAGIARRCVFHHGYLESLDPSSEFDAATALLVSQFILKRHERIAFFRAIADRLWPGGYLVSSDLTADLSQEADRHLAEVWFRVMRGADVSPEDIERMRAAYQRDVAVRPKEEVESIIAAGGFEPPTHLFQSGLIHAWYARRTREQ